MAGKREDKKQQTRKAILQAAVRLFGARGYEQTSITDLAREAGIGKGTVYSYFRNKSEIFLAFCEEQLETVAATIRRTDVPELTLLDRLVAVYREEVRFILANPEFGRILMRETFFPKELNREASRKIDGRYIDLLLPLFRQAQARGEMRTDLELTLVLGHVYGLYAVVVSAWFSQRLHAEDDVVMALHGLFEQALQGLAPTHATPEHRP